MVINVLYLMLNKKTKMFSLKVVFYSSIIMKNIEYFYLLKIPIRFNCLKKFKNSLPKLKFKQFLLFVYLTYKSKHTH